MKTQTQLLESLLDEVREMKSHVQEMAGGLEAISQSIEYILESEPPASNTSLLEAISIYDIDGGIKRPVVSPRDNKPPSNIQE